MLDGMSDSIQGSRIENLHSREVDRQSPTGLILKNKSYNFCWSLSFPQAVSMLTFVHHLLLQLLSANVQ